MTRMIRMVRYPAAGAVALAMVLIGAVRAPSAQTAPQGQLPALDQAAPSRRPDVIYVPTQPEVVDAMLKMASVTKDDVVYDLGCGDGRIVVAAARAYGAKAIGVDIDPQRIAEANANAKTAGVEGRVKFILGDLFDEGFHFRDATVVTLYLLTPLNLRLRPKLLKELKPDTRVVSHAFDMDD